MLSLIKLKQTSKILWIILVNVTVLRNRQGFLGDFDVIIFILSGPKETFHRGGDFGACGIFCFICF